MLRIIKIVTSKTYVQKALILNGFFLLAQSPGERERTIIHFYWPIPITDPIIKLLENSAKAHMITL